MAKRALRQISFDFGRRAAPSVSNVLTPKRRKARMGILFVGALLWSGVVVGRLFSLQVSDFEKWQEWASRQHSTEIELASERGPIVDREGKLLAVSVPAGSIFVRPRQVKDRAATVAALSNALKLDKKYLLSKIDPTKPFVWIERQIPRAKAEQIAALNLPGVNYVLEPKRYYPYNSAASTLIGKVGIDGNGLSGIERILDRDLHMENVKTRVIRDALGNIIQLSGEDSRFELPKGNAVKLTLDTAIQQIVDEELALGHKNANSKAVMAVMVDAETGEVLGMGQSPSPNFNSKKAGKDEMKNLLVEATFEPGSIFKPLVTAAALEEKLVNPGEMVNCESGRFNFAKHTIKDVHPSGVISVRDVVVRSSNIGMTKIGMKLGSERLYSYIRKFGFGENTKLGLPGESAGILRPVSSWAMVDVATHSFGQGVAVTPLQMVRAMSAIANGGKLPTLKLVDDGEGFELKRILSEKTSNQVREMMYGVVEDEHGTGSKAVIDGVRIGGKTGTAQKARPDGRGYMPGTYVASFVGFVDASPIGLKRTLTLAVMVDEPRTNSIYGGTLAAPVFKRIMQRTLHMLSTRTELGSRVVPIPEDEADEPKGDYALPQEGVKPAPFMPVSYSVRH